MTFDGYRNSDLNASPFCDRVNAMSTIRSATFCGSFHFITSLPGQLDRTLGRRVADIRPRWATGTSQLVAKLLAKHIDDLANRDIAMTLTR